MAELFLTTDFYFGDQISAFCCNIRMNKTTLAVLKIAWKKVAAPQFLINFVPLHFPSLTSELTTVVCVPTQGDSIIGSSGTQLQECNY